MHKLRFLSSLMVLLLLSVGIAQAQNNEKVLVIGHAESTDSLDPAYGYTQTTGIVNQVTYDTLVTFPKDSAASIEPRLASSWTVSSDGLTYTFTLRDAKFASGNPVTADDVVFSVNRLKNVQGNPSFLVTNMNIADVTATDAHTVTFTLSKPTPPFLAYLANGALSVEDSTVVKANGGTDADDAKTSDTAKAYLDNHSAGSGPYMLDHWTPQVETVLVRNPNYWGTQPYFDRVIIQNIPEGATQETSLQSGDIDLATDLSSDQITALKSDSNITITSSPGIYVHFLLMNDDPTIGGPVSNPTVQLAVRYALDYTGYQQLWGGITPGTVMAVGIAGAYGQDKAFTRDVQKAKDLLTQAGYPNGFDITLDYPTYTFLGVNMETTAQKIQSDLKDVGITVTLEGKDIQTALDDYRNGKEGFGYWFWGPDVFDPFDTLSFLPGGIVATRANWTDANADPSILALRDQAKVEIDPTKRTDLFNQIQDYYQQSGPWAPFLQPNVQVAYQSDITGYAFNPQWLLDVSQLSRTS